LKKNSWNLRPLVASDADAFQHLRLWGLQESASAFGSSYEVERERSIPQVEEHLVGWGDRVFLGGFDGDELLGMIGVERAAGAKERHVAFLRSMYVAPATRGQGLGRYLLLAALQRAASWSGVEQVKLSVTASNEPAVCLYRSAGFVEVGRMPRALLVGQDYFEELSMVRLVGTELVQRPI
jgi:ribosomal protein S18 acetylase RimI-like enzyme